MRSRRTESSDVSFLSVARTRMYGFVGRGRGGKEKNSARPGKFLEEARLSLFRSCMCAA